MIGIGDVPRDFTDDAGITRSAREWLAKLRTLALPTSVLTDKSATPGAATINTVRGRCSVAAAATSVVITSKLATAKSTVFAVISSNDATAAVKKVVPAAGSFTIYLTAATAQTNIDFYVIP